MKEKLSETYMEVTTETPSTWTTSFSVAVFLRFLLLVVSNHRACSVTFSVSDMSWSSVKDVSCKRRQEH